MLLMEERYEHKYPYDWRTKKPTIFRATDQVRGWLRGSALQTAGCQHADARLHVKPRLRWAACALPQTASTLCPALTKTPLSPTPLFATACSGLHRWRASAQQRWRPSAACTGSRAAARTASLP